MCSRFGRQDQTVVQRDILAMILALDGSMTGQSRTFSNVLVTLLEAGIVAIQVLSTGLRGAKSLTMSFTRHRFRTPAGSMDDRRGQG